MRVLIIAHGHPINQKGGGEVAAYSLHKMLVASGHESVFVGWGGQAQSVNGTCLQQIAVDEYFLYGSTEYFHFSSQSTDLFESLALLLKNFRPDVVHLHHYIHVGIEIPAVVKQILPDVKVFLTLHEYLAICANNGQLFTKAGDICAGYRPASCRKCFPDLSEAAFFMREIAVKSALGFVDAFIAPSRFLADQYVLWGIPQHMMHVVENPLNSGDTEEDAHWNEPDGYSGWRVGFFGQINFYKGLDIILGGVELAKKNGVTVEIGIHGNFSAVTGDTYIVELQSQISRLGVQAKYFGPYRQTDVAMLMRQYHWVIMGSRWYENSPVVIQESLAAGVPLIVPGHGGMAEKVGAAGLMFQPGSQQNLGKLMSTLSLKNYAIARDAAMQARRYMSSTVVENFEKVLELYAEV